MRRVKQGLIVVLVFAVALQMACYSSSIAWAEDSVSLKIEAADVAVVQAFEAVLEAETVGGNVSGLLGELEGAGRLLAEARIAYATGVLDEADSKADNAILIAGSVQNSAVSVRNEAIINEADALNLAFVTSVAGAVVFLLLLVLVWILFRRVYGRELLGMKPEVVGDA